MSWWANEPSLGFREAHGGPNSSSIGLTMLICSQGSSVATLVGSTFTYFVGGDNLGGLYVGGPNSGYKGP